MPSVLVSIGYNPIHDNTNVSGIAYQQQSTWSYSTTPYLIGLQVVPPGSLTPPQTPITPNFSITDLTPASVTPFRGGTANITYPDGLANTGINTRFIGPFAGDPPYTRSIYDAVTISPTVFSSANTGIMDVGLPTERLNFTFISQFLSASNPFVATSKMELDHGGQITVASPVATGNPASPWGHGSTPQADYKFELLGPLNDVKSASTQKPIFARVTDGYGQLSSWVPFMLPPVTRATMSIEDDTITLDARASYDIDDGIVSFIVKYNTTDLAQLLTVSSDPAHEGRVITLSLAALSSLVKLSFPVGITVNLQITAVDRAGNQTPLGVNAKVPAFTPRMRAIVRAPSGKVIYRAGSIVWQHVRQNRLYALDMSSSAVLYSDDEGTNWTAMTNAWADVSGAKPIDVCPMMRGAAFIAQRSGKILFRRSLDNETFEPAYELCPDNGTSAWCLMNALHIGSATITVTDCKITELNSLSFGEPNQWVTGTIGD